MLDAGCSMLNERCTQRAQKSHPRFAKPRRHSARERRLFPGGILFRPKFSLRSPPSPRLRRGRQDMNKATQVQPTFQKTTATFATGARSLPQRYFVSRDVFEQEQEKIFSRQWVLVGHQSQLKKSGDFFLATIAGESLIVVRDQKSEVRAFYNVCRHRGARLKEDACGHASAIQCPYHAWTYALDGRLIGAPHMDDVPGFDKADYSLHPVSLGLWEGFIFVNLADASTSRSQSGLHLAWSDGSRR